MKKVLSWWKQAIGLRRGCTFVPSFFSRVFSSRCRRLSSETKQKIMLWGGRILSWWPTVYRKALGSGDYFAICPAPWVVCAAVCFLAIYPQSTLQGVAWNWNQVEFLYTLVKQTLMLQHATFFSFSYVCYFQPQEVWLFLQTLFKAKIKR